MNIMTKTQSIIVLFVLIIFASTTQASSCKLPVGKKLVIGCTYQCDFVYRFRLNLAALAQGHQLDIINLRNLPNITEALSAIDGVLIPGGADIDPAFYLNDVDEELQNYTKENLHLVDFTPEGSYRDPYEYALVKQYSSKRQYKDLPLLGICRGMQMMSVAKGIPLYLDIKTELGIKNRRNLFDTISTSDAKSLMGSFYGDKKIRGFKYHHQGIRMSYYLKNRDKYENSKVTSISHDGKIAESLEYTHRPALGVQYHPEKSLTRASAPVFNWFLTKACEYKMSKD
jgi:gamma-glutamyl-gamma-aminobutyrate hydrolase PuuD